MYGCSELMTAVSGTLEIRILSWNGDVLWETEEKALIEADRSTRLFLLKKEVLDQANPGIPT